MDGILKVRKGYEVVNVKLELLDKGTYFFIISCN